MKRCSFLAVLVFLVLPAGAWAERRSDDRAKAPVILRGRVDSIEIRRREETDYYLIRLRVEEVERGEAVRPEDVFAVSCFRWSRPGRGKVGARGHSSIPKVGDLIRAYAWGRAPGSYPWYQETTYIHEGNYPDWYDLIEPSSRVETDATEGLFRLGPHRAAWILGLSAGIVLAGFLAWQMAKRRRKRSLGGAVNSGLRQNGERPG